MAEVMVSGGQQLTSNAEIGNLHNSLTAALMGSAERSQGP